MKREELEPNTVEKVSEPTESGWSRRAFLGSAALAGAVIASCSSEPTREIPDYGRTRMLAGPQQAADGPILKAGLVGCGGRGTGAAFDFLNAGPNLQLTALADVFDDHLQQCRNQLKERKGVEIPDDRCFLGFDAFQRVIDSDVDVVLLATPPYFRPEHFEAAVQARKHVFMEKPVAVDPVGSRAILASAEKADAFGLCVVTGTQRRHERSYIETYNRIVDGAIGEIVAARCYWNQGQLWYKVRESGWTDMEAMLRDWVNWQWLSGDHIVEQHIHNIDVVNWYTGLHPVRAVGAGARMRRVTGDQYDFFSVDFAMENGVHVHSMCRQIDGCVNSVSEAVQGTLGSSNCKDTIFDLDGNVVWSYKDDQETAKARAEEAGEEWQGDNSPYLQEHVDLVTAIRTGAKINEAHDTAASTLVAIMGRISAYTGLETTWDEMMASDLTLGPRELRMGPVDLQAEIPVPGVSTRA